MADDKPKYDALKERKSPQTEKLLRQFLSMEAGNYARPAYRENYDAAFGEPTPLPDPEKCLDCEFVAKTEQEKAFHLKSAGHGTWDLA